MESTNVDYCLTPDPPSLHDPPPMNLVQLAQRIRSARTDRQLTLEQLAERTGLTKSVLSKFENFRVTPSLGALGNIAEALGVTMSELLDGVDEKPKMVVVQTALGEDESVAEGIWSLEHEQRSTRQAQDRAVLQDPREDGDARLQPERPGRGGLLLQRRHVRALPGPHPHRGRGEDAHLRDGQLPRALHVALGGLGHRGHRRAPQPAHRGGGGGDDLRGRARPRGGPRLHDEQVPGAGAEGRQERRRDREGAGRRLHGRRDAGDGHGPAPASRRRPPRRADPPQAGGAWHQRRLPRAAALHREALPRPAQEGGQVLCGSERGGRGQRGTFRSRVRPQRRLVHRQRVTRV